VAHVDEERWVKVDGHHVAYRMVGRDDPPATVLYCTGIFLPMESMWGDPVHARLLDGLAALGGLVVYDRRGVGASDPVADWEEPILRQWARDAAAVVDDCGGPVHVFAWEWGGQQALLLAQHRPELVASVTLFHGNDRPERLEEIYGAPLASIAEDLSGWILGDTTPQIGGEDVAAALYHPSRVGDPTFDRWLAESGRRGASPSTAARMWVSMCTPGTGADLAAVRCPVLVLRRRDCSLLPNDVSADIASALPDSRLVELPGGDMAPYAGDVEPLLAEVHRFISGDAPAPTSEADRVLCGVLFSDIVGSTAGAARLGDHRWRGVLDEHDRITRLVVGRYGGRVVKQTGDGALAVFPLASGALTAAVDLRSELRTIGVEIRQAVHVGEVTDRAGDVAGMAVHVAARVLTHAGDGEIAVTQAVPLVVGAAPGDFVERDTVALRGIPGTWQVLVVADCR
jgi:class 3 adenylate cyclase